MSIASIRRSALSIFAALAFALTAIVAVGGSAQADDTAVDEAGRYGCPWGAVCIYPDDSWNGGNPSHVFRSYGTHRIYGQYGEHRVFDNQTGSASSGLCRYSNGSGCEHLPSGFYWDTNLTPINSIYLFM